MENALISVTDAEIYEVEQVEAEQPPKYSNSFTQHAKALATVNGYASDWEDFAMWCNLRKCCLLPANPRDVADYLEDRAKNKWMGISGKDRKLVEKEPLKWNSLQRRLAAISKISQYNEQSLDRKHPAIQQTLTGIKRFLSLHNPDQIVEDRKTPTLSEDIFKMIESLPKTLAGSRDKALLLIGFSGALRRSEICGLRMDSLRFVEGEGVVISLAWSKVGPRTINIPKGASIVTCPVTALRDWIKNAGIKEGYIFKGINRHGQLQDTPLTDKSIALIITRNGHIKAKIQDAKERAKEDTTVVIPNFGGHSLRAGFATVSILNGASEHSIMAHGGWKKSDTMKKYVRETDKWKNNAAASLGL
jgi:integrase